MTTPDLIRAICDHTERGRAVHTCFSYLTCRNRDDRRALFYFIACDLWGLEDGCEQWIGLFNDMLSPLIVTVTECSFNNRRVNANAFHLIDLLTDDSLAPYLLAERLEQLYQGTDLSDSDWVDRFPSLKRRPGGGLCVVGNTSLYQEIDESLHPFRQFIYAFFLTDQAYFVAQRWINTGVPEQVCDALMTLIHRQERGFSGWHKPVDELGVRRRDQATRGLLEVILTAHLTTHYHVSVDMLYAANSLFAFMMNRFRFAQHVIDDEYVAPDEYPELAAFVHSEAGFIEQIGSADDLKDMQLRLSRALINSHLAEVLGDQRD